MTWDQYWYGDVWMVRAFREAEKLRLQRVNAEAHLQGVYIYEALLDVSPILHAFAKKGTKARPYTKKPYPLNSDKEEETDMVETQKEIEAREERETAYAKLYMYNMVRAGKNWGKK